MQFLELADAIESIFVALQEFGIIRELREPDHMTLARFVKEVFTPQSSAVYKPKTTLMDMLERLPTHGKQRLQRREV